jgi:hypothetical protein
MHAVVARVVISDFEKAHQALHEEVIPRVSEMPGFVAGYWFAPRNGSALVVEVFESEEAARGMLATIPRGSNPTRYSTIENVDVHEVVGHA